MAINGIFHFYATVADLARAKQFHADTLGWKLHTDEPAMAGFWHDRLTQRGLGVSPNFSFTDPDGYHWVHGEPT